MLQMLSVHCSSCVGMIVATSIIAVLLLYRIVKKVLYPPSSQPGILTVPEAHRKPYFGAALEFLPEKHLVTLVNFAKRYGPFVDCTQFGKRTLLISDGPSIQEILGQRPKIFRRPIMITSLSTRKDLFSANGALWGRLRRGMAPFFNQQNIRLKFQVITEQVVEMIDRLTTIATDKSNQEPNGFSSKIIDMKHEGTLLTTKVITLMAFAMPMDHPVHNYFFSEQFPEDCKTLFKYQSQRRLFPYPNFMWRFSKYYQYELDAKVMMNRWDKICMEVIEFKRKQLRERLATSDTTTEDRSSSVVHRPALIDALLLKQEEQSPDALTEEELLANVKVVYIAGTETTATVVSWIPYVFMKYTESQWKVREEMIEFMLIHKISNLKDIIRVLDLDSMVTSFPYAHATSKEFLRLYSSIASLQFTLESDIPSVTLTNGLIIKAGDMIRTNFEAVHHLNSEAFPDPQAFSPERWMITDPKQLKLMDDNFLPFGYGARICPGMILAIQEIVVSIICLGYSLEFELACPAEEVYRVMNYSASATKMPIRVKVASN